MDVTEWCRLASMWINENAAVQVYQSLIGFNKDYGTLAIQLFPDGYESQTVTNSTSDYKKYEANYGNSLAEFEEYSEWLPNVNQIKGVAGGVFGYWNPAAGMPGYRRWCLRSGRL